MALLLCLELGGLSLRLPHPPLLRSASLASSTLRPSEPSSKQAISTSVPGEDFPAWWGCGGDRPCPQLVGLWS